MKVISLSVLTVPVLSQTKKFKESFVVHGEKKQNVRQEPVVSIFDWFNNLELGDCEIDLVIEQKELVVSMDVENDGDLTGKALHGKFSEVVYKWIVELIQPLYLTENNLLSKDQLRSMLNQNDLYSMWIEVVLENTEKKLVKIFPILVDKSKVMFKVIGFVDMKKD